MIEVVKSSWGWCGLEPLEIIAENDFGNLLVKDIKGRYWRICPEDLACSIVAENTDQFKDMLNNSDFHSDWDVVLWVEMARIKLGALADGQKYCLKMPSVMGGRYDAENFGIIGFEELISFSGYLAEQIKDLPDGAEIKLTFAD